MLFRSARIKTKTIQSLECQYVDLGMCIYTVVSMRLTPSTQVPSVLYCATTMQQSRRLTARAGKMNASQNVTRELPILVSLGWFPAEAFWEGRKSNQQIWTHVGVFDQSCRQLRPRSIDSVCEGIKRPHRGRSNGSE